MSRTKRFLSGISFSYLNMFLVMISGLILTPLFLKNIGSQAYGSWLLILQILGYLNLLDFGIVAIIPRETAFALGRADGKVDNINDLANIIGETARLVLWQTPLVGLVVIILWLWLPQEWQAFRGTLLVLMSIFVVTFPMRIFRAILTGLQDYKFLGQKELMVWLVSTSTTVVLVLSGKGVYGLAFGWAVTYVVTMLICFYRLKRYFPHLLPASLPQIAADRRRKYTRSSSWITLSQIGQIFLGGTDLLIIGKFLGPVAIVIYSCTGKLVSFLAHQPLIIMQIAGPSLSELKATGDRERLAQVCAALTHATMILSGLLTSVVVMVNQGFIDWWVGANQYGGLLLTLMLVLNVLTKHWTVTCSYTAFALGYEKRLLVTSLGDGIVTVGAGIFLLIFMGLPGVPLGSVVGTCCVSLPSYLYVIAKETNTSIIKTLSSLGNWFWRFTLIAIGCFLLAQRWQPRTFISLSLTTIAVSSLYILLMLPVIFGGPLNNYVRPYWERVRIRLTNLAFTSQSR